MMSSETQIRVSNENWKRINRAREPGETFDDALQRLLTDDGGETNKE